MLRSSNAPEHFDPQAIPFADISGTGASDLIYLGGRGPSFSSA